PAKSPTVVSIWQRAILIGRASPHLERQLELDRLLDAVDLLDAGRAEFAQPRDHRLHAALRRAGARRDADAVHAVQPARLDLAGPEHQPGGPTGLRAGVRQ